MMKIEQHTDAYHDECSFCADYLGEAALRILPAEVQKRVESHLARCSMCRDELSELETPLHMLAFGVQESSPSADTRQSLMTQFKSERERPSTQVASGQPVRSPAALRNSPGRPRGWLRPVSSVFAALCVALLLIGTWNLLPFTNPESRVPGGQIEVMAMDRTCEDCHVQTGGQIGADPDQKNGLVVAWNLDPQRKHEVWCVNRDGKHTKVGDLDVAGTGSVLQTVSFPDAVGGYQQIYVVRDDGAEELTVVPVISRDYIDVQPEPTLPPAE